MTIELKNIGKSYDGNSWTLNDITTEIESGEFFAIVGPSGCGKSTLLRMIAGLISISEGEIERRYEFASARSQPDNGFPKLCVVPVFKRARQRCFRTQGTQNGCGGNQAPR